MLFLDGVLFLDGAFLDFKSIHWSGPSLIEREERMEETDAIGYVEGRVDDDPVTPAVTPVSSFMSTCNTCVTSR